MCVLLSSGTYSNIYNRPKVIQEPAKVRNTRGDASDRGHTRRNQMENTMKLINQDKIQTHFLLNHQQPVTEAVICL